MASVITGTGMFVPPDVVTNADLERLMETDDEWIRTRTGVVERRIAPPGMGTADVGAEAARSALEAAGLRPEQVDALVVATMMPDYYAPGSGPLIQHALGLGNIPSYDIRQQCSGFLYGLDLADSLIAAGKAATVLLVGAEVHAGVHPWVESWRRMRDGFPPTAEERERHDRYRAWSVLFGDGGGAAVLQRSEQKGVGLLGSHLYTDGSLFDLIRVPTMGSRSQPIIDAETVANDGHLPVMQGPLLYRNAVRLMPESVERLLADHGYGVTDVDLVIAHQANERITEGVRKRLGLDAAVVPSNIDRYGNTTAGTLPILFHEMRAAGRVPPGALVVFVAFGAGAHWGAALYREP